MIIRDLSTTKARVYKVREASTLLRLGKTKIYELIKRGTLQSVKIDGTRLILADSVEALIKVDAPDI